MECVRKCEFQEFTGEDFECKLYDEGLYAELNTTEQRLMVFRCDECIKEGTIGTNTKAEYVRKLKQHLGWLGDSFYSLKDDMEEEITHIYRLIKELDEDETVLIPKAAGDNKRESDESTEEV